jgi:hypothetical protein
VQSWKRADGQEKSKTCEHSVLGRGRRGSASSTVKPFEVCIARDKCRVHFGEVIRQKEKNEKLRESGQTNKANARESAAERREQKEREKREAEEARWKEFQPKLKAATLAAGKTLKTLSKPQLAALLKALRLPATTTAAQLPLALFRSELEGAFRYGWSRDEPRLVAWAKLLGVDVKACEPKPTKKEKAA